MRRKPSTRQATASRKLQALRAELQALRVDMGRLVAKEVSAALRKELRAEVRAALTQQEAQSSLLARINGQWPLPTLHGWPISPDFGLLMTDLLDAQPYHAVVEMGSGASTYVLAAMLARPGALPSVHSHVALEHLPQYQASTQALLARLGQTARTTVQLCPLVPWAAADGTAYSYYDCGETLAQVAATLPTDGSARVLVVVDGPPGGTGRWSRYPALPWLMQAMPHAELHLLLDDYGREDEIDLAKAWTRLLTERGHTFTTQTFPCEKGALLLCVQARTLDL